MRTHVTTVYTDLAALPKSFDQVFAGAGNLSPFFSLSWYRNFIASALAPDLRPRIYAVETAAAPNRARAVLLMCNRDTESGVFGANTLRGLSNYYTSLFGPVLDPGEPDAHQMFDRFTTAIARDEIRWDVVDLNPLAVDTPDFLALVKAFRNANFIVQRYFCFGNWYLQLRGRTYAEYFESLPSQLKNTIRRRKKQVEKAGRLKMVIYKDGIVHAQLQASG